MKTKTLIATLAAAGFAVGSASAGVIVGPTDIAVTNQGVSQGADITTAQLGGEDELVIEYSVTRGDLTPGDTWLTVTFNTADTLFAFTSASLFHGLLRTNTGGTPNHGARGPGTWASGDASSVDFDAASPAEHAIRITVDGLSSGGFNGVKNITWEIDHNASSFATADRSYTGAFDFGSDDQLEIDFHSFGAGNPSITPFHTVNNFTVSAVPEPGSLALLGLGGLLMLRRNSAQVTRRRRG